MPDLSGVLLGGFSVVVLVMFLVQAFREAFPSLDSRFLPLVSLLFAGGLISLADYAPANAVKTVATAIAVGAAASLSVRYVKNGDSGSSADAVPLQSAFIQGSVENIAASPVAAKPVATPVTFPPFTIVPRNEPVVQFQEANPRGEEPRLEEAQPHVTVTMPPTK